MPQKVGRKEKLAEKVGRREIYPPVPPPSHREERTLNLGENVEIEKKIRAAGSCCVDQSSYFKFLFRIEDLNNLDFLGRLLFGC